MSYFSIEENKKLCEKYPFLIVKNRWTGKIPEDYDYSYTEIDDMPVGWFTAFGMKMLEELNEALGDFREKYFITQIKEKFGGLRWYDFGATEAAHEVIDKYEKLSYTTCIECGQPATKIKGGWISPYCDTHFQDNWSVYARVVDGELIYKNDDEGEY
jgi:hypothetical protein